MTETKKAEKRDTEKKVTLSLRGNALKQVIEIRQKKEREKGLIQSVTGVVSEAIAEKHARYVKESKEG
jgi:hypothetical protein